MRILATAVLLALTFALAPLAAQDKQPPTAPDAAEQAQGPATYDVDPAHTSVYFNVEHMNISHVFGRFDEPSGTYELDAEGHPTNLEFAVAVKSVNTGNEKRDDHLRSDDFFNVEKFPTFTLKSTTIEQAEMGMYQVTADLTLHGVTKPVEFMMRKGGGVTDPMGNFRTGFGTQLTIDRRDFGLDAWQGMVGNDITLMLAWEGIRQKDGEGEADATQ